MHIEGITEHGEVISLDSGLGLRGRVLQVGWDLPDDLSETEWLAAGEMLGKVERSVSWWLGDWWAFGENRYGQRKNIVESEEWSGPAYQTCMDTASVCRAFETSRRREVLGFTHHREVAALPSNEADELLDWCEETIKLTGKPRSTKELRAEVSKRRNDRSAICTESISTGICLDLNNLVASGKKFGCIYADPPWLYDNQGTRAATSNHYGGLTVEQLCEFPVRELAADDAHLHLWTTNGFIFDAPRIFNAWGFEFRSSYVWVKPQMGIGNYWRNSHEFLLTAIKGNAKRFNDKSLKSWGSFDRGRHSAKPEIIRQYIEKASHGPYLELFGRAPAENWTVFGNQIERNIFFNEAAE